VFVAGLTGSIATGKSTVGSMLRELGAFVVDADLASREAVLPGRPAWEEIVRVFGRDVLDPSGSIDRKRLGKVVFGDVRMLRQLEAIVHPEAARLMDERLEGIAREHPHGVAVLDVPLLFETGMNRGVEEVIVVYCPEEEQIRRLMLRDSLERGEALARIRAQISIEEKRRMAGLVIDNSGSLDATRAQVARVFELLKRRSFSPTP
jgi:dephospho-CoA kinase